MDGERKIEMEDGDGRCLAICMILKRKELKGEAAGTVMKKRGEQNGGAAIETLSHIEDPVQWGRHTSGARLMEGTRVVMGLDCCSDVT